MYTFKAMNTSFLMAGLPKELAIDLEKDIKAAERRFSRFDPASELHQLNQAGENGLVVSDAFYDCLQGALHMQTVTGGIFNPFLGLEIARAGYNISFEKLRAQQGSQDLIPDSTTFSVFSPDASPDKRLEAVPLRIIVNEAGERRIILEQGVQLDFGGIAKGWSAQQASESAIRQGFRSGLIDAGGDIIAWGKDINRQPWVIGLADPFCFGSDAVDLYLKGTVAVATSSIMKRHWPMADGSEANHIIDPRSGQSVQSAFVQVSVFAPDLTQAEAFAKYLLITGDPDSEDISGLLPENLAYIAIDRNGNILSGGDTTRYLIE